MQPANFALDIYHGDTERWQFKLWADDARTQPIDLTGAVAKSQIRDKPGSATVVATLDCVITLPNVIDVTLTSVQSFKLSSKGAWDLQLTYPDGSVTTAVAGPVTVTMDVTDSTPFPQLLP